MWPSLSAANQIADWANIFFIGSLVVGVVSTVLIVWMANVKEGYWERARQDSDERIASLVTQSDQLRKDTAEANARALEARVELEKFKAPRSLSGAGRSELIARMTAWSIIPKSGLPQSVAVFPVDSSFEAASLADQIASALGAEGAKWSINRHPVMYGKSFNVSGIGVLTSSNARGIAVAEALVTAMTDLDIFAFVIPEKRAGCEEMGPPFNERGDTDPACSSISVIVGEHPR